MTKNPQIKFLLHFVDKETIPPKRASEWAQWRQQFREFFAKRGEELPAVYRELGFQPVPMDPPLPQDFTAKEFLELQRQTRRLLVNEGGQVMLQLQLSILALPVRQNPPSVRMLIIQGTAHDLFLLTVSLLVSRQGMGEQLRRCLAPHARKPEEPCGKWFYRVRAQKYCSTICTNRVSKQKSRAPGA